MSSWFGRRAAASGASPSPPPAPQFSGPDGAHGSRSLELVRYNPESGKFEVGAEALAVLRGTRGPVGVVSVAGRARQGKSYILNQLLGRSGGFQVGPTHRPCTKGLWMWSAPVQRVAPDGSKYNLVLLDTEGIDAYDQTGQYSTQIFSLAVLLSSLFIYNQMGGIDEAALDRLSLVTEMTKHIRVRASDGGAADASELSGFTPAFLWLLRDFYLQLREEDGRAVAPRDYLEAALQPQPGAAAAVASKNQVRASIKDLFPDRDCVVLVRPVNEEGDLARLDELAPSALRPEFREGLARLAALVFQKAQPKRLGAQVLTGPALAALAEAYVAAINAGAVPTIATAWQGVAEAESRRAADEAEAAYAAAFKGEALPLDEASFEAEHQRALAAAQAAFERVALGDEGVRGANERRWRQAAAARFRDVKDKRLAAAELAAERAVNEGAAQLAAAARREGATLADLEAVVSAFQQRYMNDPAVGGPTKARRFADFMRSTYGGAVQDLAARREERQRAALAAAQQAERGATAAAEQATARATSAEGAAGPLRARVVELERQLAAAHAELARERQAGAAAAAQLAAAAQATAGREGERAALAQQAQQAQQAAQQARSDLAAVQRQLEAAHAEVRRCSTAAAGEVHGTQQRLAAAEAQAAALQTAVQAATASATATEAAKAAAERRAGELQTQATALQTELAAARQQLQQAQQDQLAQQGQQAQQVAALQSELDALRAAVAAAPAPAAAPPSAPAMPKPASPAAAPPLATAPEHDEAMGDGAGPSPGIDASKMKIGDIKTWLMDHGHEAAVWELSQKKGAKKADWVELANSLSA